MPGHENRIDPVHWRPLIMSFCHFFGLGGILRDSALVEIPESAYRPVRREVANPGRELVGADLRSTSG